MSNIYIQEPPTNGKVLLRTSVGDIDVELWSKEAPKACRNFVQLCLEGYYNGTIFHRLIKGFIVQGGDPEGDGTGGVSIYGQPFKDEFHSRLRFVRRGLVAMANSGKDDNECQFFFTLGATPELQNKNTIFAQVTGKTLYNMLKLEDGLVDHDDRPLYPHKIITAEVLLNPFPDIVPRISQNVDEPVLEKPKKKIKKNFKLLSFGEEAEEDEAEMEVVNEVYKGQSKSSHDLIDDPKLSSVPAIEFKEDGSCTADPAVLESIRKKLEKNNSEKVQSLKGASEINQSEEDESLKKRKDIKKQIKELKKELSKKKDPETVPEEEIVEKEPEKEENEYLAHFHEQLTQCKSKQVPRKGTTEREAQTLMLFEKFKSDILTAKENHPEDDATSANEDDDDDGGDSWLAHSLRTSDEKVVLAKDVNLPSAERYDLTDPRNPITERRRNEKRKR